MSKKEPMPHIHIKESHRGMLHKDVGVKAGHHIPLGTLEKAAHSGNEAERKRAQFALNARHWKHK